MLNTPGFGQNNISRISLISKSNIRYEGTLYSIDPSESTVALSNVRSFGTEDRAVKDFVPASNEIYEYIIFRGNDIKDLTILDIRPNTDAAVNPNQPPLGVPPYGYMPPGAYPPPGVPYGYGWGGYPAGPYNPWGVPMQQPPPQAQPQPQLQPPQTTAPGKQSLPASQPGAKPTAPAPTTTTPAPVSTPSPIPPATTVPPVDKAVKQETHTISKLSASEKLPKEKQDTQPLSKSESTLSKSQHVPAAAPSTPQPQPVTQPVQQPASTPAAQQPAVQSTQTSVSQAAQLPAQPKPIRDPKLLEPKPIKDPKLEPKSEVAPEKEPKSELAHKQRNNNKNHPPKQTWSQKTAGTPATNSTTTTTTNTSTSNDSDNTSNTSDDAVSGPKTRGGYRGGRGGPGGRGGRGGGGVGRGGARPIRNDFDLERAAAAFDKEKEMKEIEEHHEKVTKERERAVTAAAATLEKLNPESADPTIATDVDLETAYNPKKSIFDTLSCDTFDRLAAQDGSERSREPRRDNETFGRRGRGRGGNRGGSRGGGGGRGGNNSAPRGDGNRPNSGGPRGGGQRGGSRGGGRGNRGGGNNGGTNAGNGGNQKVFRPVQKGPKPSAQE